MVASIVRLEGEQKVNTYTASAQSYPNITGLADGGWVVTWTSLGQDGLGYGIYQQRYNPNGSLNGTEQQVNTYTNSNQEDSSVTALADGGWVVTWTSFGQDSSGYGIYQQRYNANGSLNGIERKVNTYTSIDQESSSVTALADGGWVVTWTSFDQDGSGYGIYQQRYNADSSLNGTEQRVNTYTNSFEEGPSVTALADGGWVVTWQSAHDGAGNGVYQQRYDPDGNPRDSEQRVNTYTTSSQDHPSVTALAGGGWVVTWQSNGQDGSDRGIYQQRYTPVIAFGEGKESGAGSAGNEVFQVSAGGLSAGDSLEAGSGIDTLRMIETGTLDLTAPDLLIGIELVQGTSGNDVIITNTARITDIIGFQGGGGSDALHLQAGNYDLTSRLVAGIEAITLLGTGSITFADKATALLAHSQTADGTLILTGDSFTLAERTQLYSHGIRIVTDAGGTHILQPAATTLSQAVVQENVATGTPVGVLLASDPNPGDGVRFELIDGAGGRFGLSGNQLVVANGQLLDYERGSAHQIVVRVTDEGGISFEKAFSITIGDEPVETLRGTSGNNVLTGGAGQDRLNGGLGKDILTGGGGGDVFVFDTKPNTKTNLDRITDFNVTDDALWLDNAIFKALGKAGSVASPAMLKTSFFYAGAAAHDSSDRLIYNKKSGALYYDADGTGAAKQVQIATLSKKLALSHKDFFVI